MDDSQGSHKYDIIVGRDIFFELQIYICFYDNTIKVNRDAYEICIVQMKEVTRFNFNASSAWLHGETFWNE